MQGKYQWAIIKQPKLKMQPHSAEPSLILVNFNFRQIISPHTDTFKLNIVKRTEK